MSAEVLAELQALLQQLGAPGRGQEAMLVLELADKVASLDVPLDRLGEAKVDRQLLAGVMSAAAAGLLSADLPVSGSEAYRIASAARVALVAGQHQLASQTAAVLRGTAQPRGTPNLAVLSQGHTLAPACPADAMVAWLGAISSAVCASAAIGKDEPAIETAAREDDAPGSTEGVGSSGDPSQAAPAAWELLRLLPHLASVLPAATAEGGLDGTACSHSDWRAGHRRVCRALGEARRARRGQAAAGQP
ncbi:hypothetical protein ABPG75_006843 [Micractinium tetrahymenae]